MHDIANQIVLPVVVILTLCMLALNVIAFHRLGLISRDLRWMRVKLLDLERLVAKDPPLMMPSGRADKAPPDVIVVDEQAARALDAAAKAPTDGSVIYLTPGRRRP
ncbi:hypothetical protein [Bosea sp. RAC05]|uniref:hypothetical protein n=1 Tax=Bosea sp. RAC05 TaxID=1842539 RepID=UPI00083DE4D3|nr:hypothetical protein [Bosea sp. RAC05]AOG03271.1 hypothetical protein BSY19_4771 [Bosea sp. RAC05]